MSHPSMPFDFYEVQRILQRGHSEGQRYYLVKWKGFSEEEATWEPVSNLTGCKKAIDEFEQIMKIIEDQKTLNKHTQTPKKNNRNKKAKPQEKSPIPNVTQIQENHQKQTPEPKETKTNFKQSPKSQNCLNLALGSKNRVINGEKSKDSTEKFKASKDLVESCAESSESVDLEPTTAQTVPPNIKTERLEAKELEFMSQQIKLSKVTNSKNVQKQGFKFEDNKDLMNFESNQTVIETKVPIKPNITDKSEHINPFKRAQTVKNPLNQDQQKELENFAKKRILSSTEDLANVLESQKDKTPKKNQLKISHNVSEIITSVQPLKQERKIFTIKKYSLEESHQSPEIQPLYPAVSQRSRVCEEESEDFIFDMIDELLPRANKGNINANKAIFVKNLAFLEKLPSKFIDLTRKKFMDVNYRLFSYMLSKEEVQQEDNKGELIYSKIDRLIRGVEVRDGVLVESWVSLMIEDGREGGELEKNEATVRLMRVDDLEEGLWRKLFRRFMMKKSE